MENYISLFTQNGSLPLLFALSFLGGLVASISPCSLAMLPIIIGYIGGYSDAKPLKTFIQMLFFVFGTAIVFSVIGIICAITGKVFISFAGGYFGIFLAGIIMVMGLKLIGVLDFELPVMIKEMPKMTEQIHIFIRLFWEEYLHLQEPRVLLRFWQGLWHLLHYPQVLHRQY